ncbi:MAG TPA: transposase, partial [Alphaproteobacteria bacterium]|nr:transposase [Alphaproteobacteria bacterium]
VKWNRLSLQLPPSRLRPHFVKATVRVHQYPDGTIAVFLGPHRLADYDARGRIIETIGQAA